MNPCLRPALGLLLLLAAPYPGSAARNQLALTRTSLGLPGAPAAIVATDLDGDGRQDLAIAVVYTRWDQIGVESTVSMDEVEGLVEVLTIVPALLDQRRLFLFLGQERGGYVQAGEPLQLPPSVLSIAAGPPGFPLLALTDEGISVLRLEPPAPNGAFARFEPLVAEPPPFAGSATFVAELGLVHELDGAPPPDLLLPAGHGFAVYLGKPEGWGPEAASRPRVPAELEEAELGEAQRGAWYLPLPKVRDVDGDGARDLVLAHPGREWREFRVLLGRGDGSFGPARNPLAAWRAARPQPPAEKPVLFEDLDGDGRAELVTREDLENEKDGFKADLEAAKNPRVRYHLHHQRGDGQIEPQPFRSFEVLGYAMTGADDLPFPGGFRDLDGDGKQDLVSLTLDFSVLQAVKLITVQRISIGLDFHVFCQTKDGRFQPVQGLDLSGRFSLDLSNLQLGQLSQFAGDFDGDGRADFVQMGRGKRVTIHRGRPGCAYPASPDLVLELAEEPRDLSLVQVRDLDADGLADLLFIQPQKAGEAGVTPPVRLDLYLSGAGER